MRTPFLSGFTRAVLGALATRDLVEITPGSEERVVGFVADRLGSVPQGGSLISSLSRALLACPDVVELFADDDELKRVVEDLDSTPAAWVRG